MKNARFGIVGVLAIAALAVAATVATTASGKSSAGEPIVIGAAVDLTSSMKPFDSPALAGAQIEAKKLAAAGGPNFVIKVCNHQLKKQKSVCRAADRAGRQDRDRHVRRRVRRRRDAGVHQPRDPHDLPVRDHRPDGPAALRRQGQARLHDGRHRAGRGLGRRRVRLVARLEDGDRRQGQLPRLLPRRLRRVREALPGARREDRRPAGVHVLPQGHRQRDQQGRRRAGRRDLVRDRVRRAAAVRRRHPLARATTRRSSTRGAETAPTGTRRTPR